MVRTRQKPHRLVFEIPTKTFSAFKETVRSRGLSMRFVLVSAIEKYLAELKRESGAR